MQFLSNIIINAVMEKSTQSYSLQGGDAAD